MAQHLETTRLTLRPWRESDAAALFRYARDPSVGPRAGWTAHGSVEESRQVIREVLAVPESYAIVLKRRAGDLPVGAIALMFGATSELARSSREAELGYWVGRPLWGQGLVPEAAAALLEHAFSDLRLDAVWASYYEGNEQSRRVQEKLGFVPERIIESLPRPRLGDAVRAHVNALTRERWTQVRHTHRGLIDEQQAEKRDIIGSRDLVAIVRSGGQTGADPRRARRRARDGRRPWRLVPGGRPRGGPPRRARPARPLPGAPGDAERGLHPAHGLERARLPRDAHRVPGRARAQERHRGHGRLRPRIRASRARGRGRGRRTARTGVARGRRPRAHAQRGGGRRASKAPQVYDVTREVVRSLLA